MSRAALVTVGVLHGLALMAADLAVLQAPRLAGPPMTEHAVTNRAFTGIPSMAIAPGGRLWATWYAGVTPAEDRNNYVVLSTSSDGGATWSEVLVVDPDGAGPLRTFDPELWVSPDGRLFFFWAQRDCDTGLGPLGVWCMETREPDAAQPAWTAPRRLADGVMMCKPLVLSTGEWALPVSIWREHDLSAQFLVSTNAGRSWAVRGAAHVPATDREFDEHLIVERRDGSLWMLVRTKYGIGESVSTDRGVTWPGVKPSALPHPSARFFITRLASGNLLLVKHGPLNQRTGRSHLTAFASKDDGATWGGGLLLDERSGVSYPDGQQTGDGKIRVIYDFNRTTDRQILFATFREEDAAAGTATSDAVRLQQVVSQASGGRGKNAAPAAVNEHRDGEPLRVNSPGALACGDAKAEPFVVGAKMFTDRSYVAFEVPAALRAAQFLPVAMNGGKTVTCIRAGTTWFLTPEPVRNRDTLTARLTEQGFKKVALPETRLFAPENPGNFCTLYQKDCAAGETIVFGKWAVPLFLP